MGDEPTVVVVGDHIALIDVCDKTRPQGFLSDVVEVFRKHYGDHQQFMVVLTNEPAKIYRLDPGDVCKINGLPIAAVGGERDMTEDSIESRRVR